MKILGSVVIVFSVALAALAETATISPSADTTLFENSPDDNMGGVLSFAAGTIARGLKSRGLIKFDVASRVPAGMVVSAARLRVNVVRAPSFGAVPSTFLLRRVLRNWGEGNKVFVNLGQPATAGEATWRNRLHPATPWQTVGGAVGVDFASAVSSSSPSTDAGTMVFDTSSQMVADVQDWITNPSQNFGWVIMTDSEPSALTARRFGSKEDSENAAYLEVDYGPPFRIENVALSGATLRFSFPVEPLYTYTVQSSASLAAGSLECAHQFH